MSNEVLASANCCPPVFRGSLNQLWGRLGDPVDLERAVPNKREGPVHKRCYVDAYGGRVWMEDY